MKTAHFRIKSRRTSAYTKDGCLDFTKDDGFIVEKRHWWFWWIPEKGGYWAPFGQGNEYVLKFNTEAEALEYINKQPYQTKVLWTDR